MAFITALSLDRYLEVVYSNLFFILKHRDIWNIMLPMIYSFFSITLEINKHIAAVN